MKRKVIDLVTVIISVFLGFIWLYPFIIILINSLKNRAAVFSNPLSLPHIYLRNYPAAFKALDFVSSFFNSLFITVASVALITVLSAMAAYALARVKRKTSSIIYYLCAGTMLIPFQSIMIPLVTIFGRLDFLNRFSLIIMNTGLALSLSIILYYGAFLGVPRTLDEAAILDGASTFKAFFKIIMPAVSPMTGTVIILNAMKIWNDYLLPSLVINKAGMYTLPLRMYYFFGETNSQWELALAGLVLAIIPVIILFILLQKQIMESATEGAIK